MPNTDRLTDSQREAIDTLTAAPQYAGASKLRIFMQPPPPAEKPDAALRPSLLPQGAEAFAGRPGLEAYRGTAPGWSARRGIGSTESSQFTVSGSSCSMSMLVMCSSMSTRPPSARLSRTSSSTRLTDVR